MAIDLAMARHWTGLTECLGGADIRPCLQVARCDVILGEVIEETAVLVVVRHQPQLGPRHLGEDLATKCSQCDVATSSLLSAAINPRMFSCLSITVW